MLVFVFTVGKWNVSVFLQGWLKQLRILLHLHEGQDMWAVREWRQNMGVLHEVHWLPKAVSLSPCKY